MFMTLCVTLAVCDLLGVAGLRFQLAIHGLEMTPIVRAEFLHGDDHDNEQQHSDGDVGFREECCDYRLTLRPDTTKSNYRGGYDVEGYVSAPVRLHMSLKEFLGIFIPFHDRFIPVDAFSGCEIFCKHVASVLQGQWSVYFPIESSSWYGSRGQQKKNPKPCYDFADIGEY